MFRRRGRTNADESIPTDESSIPDEAQTIAPTGGPIDSLAATDDAITRLDLGSLLVPGAEGMEVRLEVDQITDAVIAVTVIDGTSAMQIMPFAAPRIDGIWDEVRAEIHAGLTEHGPVTEVTSQFGVELRATVPVATDDGSVIQQPVRFLGFNGPRWFVRAVISGDAGGLDSAPALEAVLGATIVVRGTEPMAPGDPLPLQFPTELPDGIAQGTAEEVEAESRRTLPLPERGPEITEIR